HYHFYNLSISQSPTHRSPLLQRHRRSSSPSRHHSSSSRCLRPPCLPVPAVVFGSLDSAKQMDLETENRLAAMLMREAAELQRQSEQEGVLAYLRKPNVRTRPNSRFLTATVRGVQQ
ncbi:hypothetical protein PIB30_104454, partial [Stylosanthes scabra]|nr:hypothetical protein [Stylosanthes scabra]